ncbi:MAG: hypothetical protein ABSB25_07715 [Sedimentisphaerales bacterium]|jgi:hypothetical protein
MAGNVFVCKWERIGQQWHVWVKGKPKLSGWGETLDAAKLQLEQEIWGDAKNGDDVIPTVMEFDPPLPVSERTKRFFIPEIYYVYGDEIFSLLGGYFLYGQVDAITMEYANSLYEGGICKVCMRGIGKRTEVEFKTELKIGDSDGLFLRHSQIHASAWFFSDRFISLLTNEERKRLKFRECQVKRKGKRKYYELVGNSIANNVGVKGFDAGGHECAKCGNRGFSITELDLDFSMQNFICRADLPDPLPSCFAVNIDDVIYLCLARERWDQIRGNKNAKGIISEPIGVVDEELCERHPRLQTSIKECERCSSWQDPGWKRGFDLPATGKNLTNHPAVVWLKNEMENPKTITIVRQEDTVEHIVEMAESGSNIKEGKTISFRCPDCWRLGKLFVTRKHFGMAW